MATTTKKGSKNKRAKLRGSVVKTSVAEQAQTIAELRQELEARNRDLTESLQRENATTKELQDFKRQLAEALEQQTATSEILCVIASSPTDLQPVLDAVAENAARLCDSNDATIHRVDGNLFRRVAHYGPVPVPESQLPRISRGFPAGRAILDRQTIHVADILAEIETEFPEAKPLREA
jgi:hypothetical protein